MFSELETPGSTSGLKNIDIDSKNFSDNNQIGCWSTLLNRVPILRQILVFIGQKNSAELGGLYHRGRNSYSMECMGLIYLIFFFYMLSIDMWILAPVLRGDITKVATDQRPLDSLENPTIK